MHSMRQLLAILFLSLASGASASTPFQDYQVILERRPFGAAPILNESSRERNMTPAAGVAQFPYRLSALYEGMDGQIRAGLVNKQTNKSLTLSQEEDVDGIKLLEADLIMGTASLSEGNQTFILELTAGAPDAGPPGKPSRSSNTANTSRFAERRRQLMERMNKKKQEEEAEKPRLYGEELKKHLQDYQMEVIRNGMPALPIPLTEEMDQQLVEEGVLPPAE